MADDNDKTSNEPQPSAALEEKAAPVPAPRRPEPGDPDYVPRPKPGDFSNPPGVEDFPEKVNCNQCRRAFTAKELRGKSNTLLTETALICPRCRRKLHKFRLKEWYDRYVQGQVKDFKLDPHAFFHVDPADNLPDGVIASMEPPPPPPQREERGGRRRGRGRGRGGRDSGNPAQNQQGRGPNQGGRNQGQRQPQGQAQGQPQGQRPGGQRPKSILPQNVKAFRLPKRRRNKQR